MKIEDLTDNNAIAIDASPVAMSREYGAKRNAAHPEVAELLTAREANKLFDCQSMARDEIELANFIVNKLDVNPHYVPSETLLRAIRDINDKLAGRSSLHGMIRSA